MNRFIKDTPHQSITDAINYTLKNQRFNKCLDAGCAGNQYKEILLKYCKMVIGIDLEPKREDQETIKGNILHMTMFKDQEFDLIFSTNVMEHIKKKELNQFFSEIDRVTKPNGIMIITTPNQFALTRIYQLMHWNYLDKDHKFELNYYTAKKLQRELTKRFNYHVDLLGYSSWGSMHKKIADLWKVLPGSFRWLPYKHAILGRGFIFRIHKKG